MKITYVYMHALPSLEETNVIIELLYSKIFNTCMVMVKIKKIPTARFGKVQTAEILSVWCQAQIGRNITMKDSFFIYGDGKKIVFVLESYPFELSSNQYIYIYTHIHTMLI